MVDLTRSTPFMVDQASIVVDIFSNDVIAVDPHVLLQFNVDQWSDLYDLMCIL